MLNIFGIIAPSVRKQFTPVCTIIHLFWSPMFVDLFVWLNSIGQRLSHPKNDANIRKYNGGHNPTLGKKTHFSFLGSLPHVCWLYLFPFSWEHTRIPCCFNYSNYPHFLSNFAPMEDSHCPKSTSPETTFFDRLIFGRTGIQMKTNALN